MVRQSGRLRSEQHWDIVRQLLHPMLMQNYSGQAIADAFGISVDTAYRWKRRLLDDLRKEAVSMQPRDFVMESVSSLRQVRAEA
ncbi:helix-turn-helix domain-containing protein [Ruegeria halocynthiae]|uniref:helix-turn-helix domain-containing protein n=1 Tax=Ruegeria halocynthiae TaxID=985054 RepID=UPI0009432CF1